MSAASATGFPVRIAHEMCEVCSYKNVSDWDGSGRKEKGGLSGFGACGPGRDFGLLREG